MNRRQFLQQSASATALVMAGCATPQPPEPPFKISLAEWSLHRELFSKIITNLDFPRIAHQDYGIDAIELVNQFMMQQATDQAYLADLKRRADDEGVRILLIMCDGEGNLGDPDPAKRRQAVVNHHKWADAAKFLGCHSIRVNAATGDVGTFAEQQQRAADGLAELSAYCAPLGLNCIVENHGGLSSNGQWLAGVMRLVGKPNCGTLPDFGNFQIKPGEWYDRYQGVAEMMPWAKAVSAKSYDFNAAGYCVETDYPRMIKIVLDAGYHGYLGIEYEGDKLSEADGIRATKQLLERIREGSA
ncbi:MAG TPA: sugar phosphate isomerase/epimerase family protein [Verrucomicrobiota bacterium]|nr:sugar phosphate isomerase/epimerase family protein [Verrucomicrobiota bacterium]